MQKDITAFANIINALRVSWSSSRGDGAGVMLLDRDCVAPKQRGASVNLIVATAHSSTCTLACREKDAKKQSGDGGKNGDGEDDEDDDGGNNAAGNEVVWMTDTSAAAARKRAEEQLSDAMAGMVTQVGS